MDLPFRLSYIRLRNAQNIESVELILDDGRHHDIPEQRRGVFSRSFDEPLMFPTEKLSLSVGRRKSPFGLSRSSDTVSELISISSVVIVSRFREKGVNKNHGKVTVTHGVLSVTLGIILQTKSTVTTPSVHANPEARQATATQLAFRAHAVDGAGIPTPANREGLRPTVSLPLQLSYIALEDAKDAKSVEFVVNDTVYLIPRSQQRSDSFRKDFDEPLTLSAGQLSISVRRKQLRLRFGHQLPVETLTIGSGDVLSRLEGHVFQQKRGELLITLGFASQTQIASRVPNPNPSSPANAESLQPNTKQLVVVGSVPADIAVGGTGTSEPSDSEGLQPTTQGLVDTLPAS
ncbi:hypothetical protein M404DRAFT_1008445 [Pisolithus tinctorius Marx 270]|uniref:Uncharacterized protein n=1 Tax=Pisolithus tinctorius Marx 270 TaxID=870435 RepID=A0A0C3NFQ0_PISTI|nr:hypothetical protein M404DRAFT_1008445 [Pisolithus tinctorius Marx 270]